MKRYRLPLILLMVLYLEFTETAIAQQTDFHSEAGKLRYENLDSSLLLYNKAKEGFLLSGDTLNIIRVLIETSKIHSSNANYSKAYDGYWEALILSSAISDDTELGRIYAGLAVLYSLFERNTEAELYFRKSVETEKKLLDEGRGEVSSLLSTYTTMANHHRENGNYGIAQVYVDSCQFIRETASDVDGKYVDAVRGVLLLYQNKPDEALELLLQTEKKFLNETRTYLVILYSFIGEVYFAMDEPDKSETYYNKSLEIANRYKSHQNFIPGIYKKLAELYFSTGQLRKAYRNLQKSMEMADQYFGARSATNRSLLEIKDEFRMEMEKQQKFVEKTRLTELEHESRILTLRSAILSISIAFMLIISIVIIYYLRNRHRTEKRIMSNNQMLKEQSNRQILELKNKELTTSALQLIEKDELLLEIKNILSDQGENSETLDKRALISKITVNRKKDWKEFDARFTSVNQSFYTTLDEKFPELTKGDQKICALIKLNFSSKEMSQLLGISTESVHSSRYRIRKKMNLATYDNLEEIIARL